MNTSPPNSATDLLDQSTTTANSGIILDGARRAIVELDPDHPGFRDQEYRDRRNAIAQIAVDFVSGQPVPDAPYTDEEHGVWETICDNISPAHQKWACKEYLDYYEKLGYSDKRIPQLREVSTVIEALSGFRLEPVAGLVLPKIFLSHLGEGIFLSTQYIRHYSTPLYTPEPDVVHELIGHAAMLANPKFAELNRLMGQAAKRTTDDDEVERLGRVYWYTIEFGVLREGSEVKAYGAGLLSSFGELDNIPEAEHLPFDPEDMMNRPYDVTRYQPYLYCADSFDHMYDTLKDFLAHWKV
jgi:phenylalanine-4-hydroxylase